MLPPGLSAVSVLPPVFDGFCLDAWIRFIAFQYFLGYPGIEQAFDISQMIMFIDTDQ